MTVFPFEMPLHHHVHLTGSWQLVHWACFTLDWIGRGPIGILHRFEKGGSIGAMIDEPLFPRRRPLVLPMPIFPSTAFVSFLERLYPHHPFGGMDPQQGVADIGEFIHAHTPLTCEV
jgi:hypothetical protein